MRRIGEAIPVIALGMIVGGAVWSTMSDWSYLVAAGGWFALLGRFMAVSATLVFVFVVASLAFAVLVLPLLAILGFTDVLEPGGPLPGDLPRRPGLLLRLCLRGTARGIVRAAEPAWKGLWWSWWYLAGRYRR